MAPPQHVHEASFPAVEPGDGGVFCVLRAIGTGFHCGAARTEAAPGHAPRIRTESVRKLGVFAQVLDRKGWKPVGTALAISPSNVVNGDHVSVFWCGQ